MKKGSALILITVVAVAVIGLAFIIASNIESPTGNAIGSGSSIPMSLSGQVLNCGISSGKLVFTRSDGNTYRGTESNFAYSTKVKVYKTAVTQFAVAFVNGPFIQTLVLPIPTSNSMQVDLSCATPVPTNTPVPTSAPSQTPTPTI
jgi:hypothetical protein